MFEVLFAIQTADDLALEDHLGYSVETIACGNRHDCVTLSIDMSVVSADRVAGGALKAVCFAINAVGVFARDNSKVFRTDSKSCSDTLQSVTLTICEQIEACWTIATDAFGVVRFAVEAVSV